MERWGDSQRDRDDLDRWITREDIEHDESIATQVASAIEDLNDFFGRYVAMGHSFEWVCENFPAPLANHIRELFAAALVDL